MYQIIRITDRAGVDKTGEMDGRHLGCIGDPKMEEGCVLFHCRYDRQGESCDRYIRTSLVQAWEKDKESGRIVIETMNSVYHLEPLKK